MSIKTNHSQDSLVPDSGVLTVDATGALALPTGSEIERPLGAAAGHIRFDQTSTKPEYYDGAVWDKLTSKTYVDVNDQNLQDQINNIISNVDPVALDSLTEIVQAFQNADGSLNDAITALATTLNNNLAQEVADREAGDQTLQSNLDTVETNLQAQINSILSNLDPAALDSLTEIVEAFQNADTGILATLSNSIASATADLEAEAQARQTGDDNLYDTIQTVIESYQDADIQEEQARIAGDATLQSNLDDEVARAIAAEQALQDAIDVEHQHHIDAEALLQTNLDTETQNRIDGDNTLQTNLDTETQNRIDADDALDQRVTTVEGQVNGKIGDLTTLTTDTQETIVDAINEVDANIDAEVVRATSAEQQLQDTIDNLSLDSLTDVRINLPTEGQVISFDPSTGEFKNQTHQFNVLTKNFVADGSTAEYALNETVASQNNLVVSINGILQKPGYSYTLANGDTLVFDEFPESGDLIEVRILKSTVTNDRPRPTVTNVTYGTIANYTTITITATDITFGTGARIDNDAITRIDYPTSNTMQLMIETTKMTSTVWNTPRDLTLVDTSGNEFVFTNLINYGASKPQWTNSNPYIGTFSGGDTINFALALNNATSITIDPAYAGESAIQWLSISGNSIVGTAPNNSSPSRYEIAVTATNGSVNITKNFWLMVL